MPLLTPFASIVLESRGLRTWIRAVFFCGLGFEACILSLQLHSAGSSTSSTHLAVPYERLEWHVHMSWGGRPKTAINIDHDDTPRDLEEPKMQTRPGWLPFLLLHKRIKEPEGHPPPSFSASNCIQTNHVALVSGRAARHAACHSNFTLLGLKNQALSWLFSIEVSDELYVYMCK